MYAIEHTKAIVVLWVMTGLSFILVPLRLYTRIYLLNGLGLDDHFFNLGWVFMLLHTIFYTAVGEGASGQLVAGGKAANDSYKEMIGQTFAVLGLAIANISLGIFLLRIVVKAWHRISIWIAMVSVSLVSIMMVIVLWIQRTPTRSIYDPSVPGRTLVPVKHFSLLLGSWCTMVDFFFAIIPWVFIWELNMRFKEKLTITMSFSLGFIAGICGIIRTIELSRLPDDDFTEDTITLIVWSAIELSVTLICVGIPTVRPLYHKMVHRSTRSGSSKDNGKGDTIPQFDMPMRKFSHLPGNAVIVDGDFVMTDFHDDDPRYADRIRVQHEVRIEATNERDCQ